MARRLLRLLWWLVPAPWRAPIRSDIEDEAARGRRGAWWVSWQAIRAGIPLRRASLADLIVTDVRQSARSLMRTPGFTAAAVVSFALGIGANVALLSVIDRLMFRPLPFAEGQRLVTVYSSMPDGSLLMWHATALALQERARTVDGFATAYGTDEESVIDGLGSAPVRLGSASANLLGLLGVRPVAGRDFTPKGDAPGGASGTIRELLVTDALWRTRFGSSPDVIDRIVGRDERRYRIVGVLPPDFVNPAPELGGRIDGLLASSARVEGPARDRTSLGPRIARLAPGFSLADARAEFAAIHASVAAEHPDFRGVGLPVQVNSLQAGIVLPYARFLWLILAAAVVVLLIACVNLSTLLLARSRARTHESAIRASLGASRRRLALVGAIDALVLCTASAGVTLMALVGIQSMVLHVVPPAFQGFAVSALDVRLVVLTFGLAAISSLLAAVAPALAFARFDPQTALRRRGAAAAGRRKTTGTWLLAGEAALTIVLVAGAGAAVRSFGGLVFRDPGFVAKDLYTLSVFFEPDRELRNMERVRAFDTVAPVIDGAPGVVEWTAVTRAPVARGTLQNAFWTLRDVEGGVEGITGNTFDVLGSRVLFGRAISDDDVRTARAVAVVNLRAAAALWPGEDPESAVGRQVTMPYGGIRDVIGVVSDIRSRPGVAARASLYVPLGDGVAASGGWAMEQVLLLRMAPGRIPDREALMTTFQAVVPTGMVGTPVSVSAQLAPWLDHPRFQAALFGSLAVIALVLACVGLYAVAAFDAACRRHETGVRLAMGATRGDIRRSVIGGVVRPVALGSAAGLTVAWWAAQYLQAFLFEVDARDPWTLALVAGALFASAVVAAWLPARRAARTDPASVLRTV